MSQSLAPQVKKRKRRWFRYSLKTLLLVMLLLCILFAWVRSKMERARKEEKAVLELRQKGYSIWYDHYDIIIDDASPSELPPAGPRWLHNLLGDTFFVHVERVWCPYRAKLASPDLEKMSAFTEIKALSLNGSSIMNDAPMHLSRLKSLRKLSLYGSQISDSDLVHLSKLTNLHHLDLTETQITNAGLIHLRQLKRLESLSLTGTKVDEQGRESLQEYLPNTDIDLR